MYEWHKMILFRALFFFFKKKQPKKTLFWVYMGKKCFLPYAEHM